MSAGELNPEHQAEADRLEAAILESCRDDVRRLARLLASKPDGELLGDAEFEVRDRVHAIGAKAIQSALEGRKKGATGAPPTPAPAAAARPSSTGGNPGGS